MFTIKNIRELLEHKRTFFIGLLIIAVLFSFDIWTKRSAFSEVDDMMQKTAGVHASIRITSFLNIVKVVNTGISFGLFDNIKYGQFILSFIILLIVVCLLLIAWKSNNDYKIIVYSLIISGGLGNLYDRIVYGGVFDFLDFHIGDYHWPAFNVADTLICIGIFLLILDDIMDFLINRIRHNI